MLTEELMDLKEASERLKVHPQTLRRAIANGELEAVSGVGRGYRVTQEALNTWVASKVKVVEVKADA